MHIFAIFRLKKANNQHFEHCYMVFGYAELVFGLTFEVRDYLWCENCKKRHFCLKVVMSVLGVGLVKFFGCLNYGHKLHLVVTLCFLHMSGVCHFFNFEDIFMNS